MKTKICKRCQKEKRIWARGMCRQCDMVANPVKYALERKKVAKAVGKIKTKKESITQLKSKLDKVFSLYIRLRDADENGMVACFTSGKIGHYTKQQAGHYISRRHMATRWNEQNVQVQSVSENIFNQGNAPMFAIKLDEKYGNGTAKKLVQMSQNAFKMGRFEYEYLIKDYTEKVNELKKKLNIE